MGIKSELYFDHDKCENCGCELSEHIAGKRPIHRLHRSGGTLYDAVIYRIVCDHCGHTNEVFYFGQSIAEFFSEFADSEFACVPAL